MSFDKGSLRESFNRYIFLIETSKQIVLNIYLNCKNDSIQKEDLHKNAAHVKKTSIGKGGSLKQERPLKLFSISQTFFSFTLRENNILR